jgi:hypothetical protein
MTRNAECVLTFEGAMDQIDSLLLEWFDWSNGDRPPLGYRLTFGQGATGEDDERAEAGFDAATVYRCRLIDDAVWRLEIEHRMALNAAIKTAGVRETWNNAFLSRIIQVKYDAAKQCLAPALKKAGLLSDPDKLVA